MEEELSVLKSIYLNDLTINHGEQTSVSITIYSNGDENDLDRDKRLLCVTLTAELPTTYPHSDSPKITFCRCRGLKDEQLDELNSSIISCLALNFGSCVLYDCIELVRSKLSLYELPHEPCAICLTLIHNRSDIVKTNCYHFYHKQCLASYIQVRKMELEEKYQEAKNNRFYIERDFRNDIEDPVCRQILSNNIIEQLSSLLSMEIIHNDEEENHELIKKLSPSIKQWQERTHELFQRQQEKGGIIDLDKTHEYLFEKIHMAKDSNILPTWGNKDSMNLNSLLLNNIMASQYFKVNLYERKTYLEVVDEIYYQVKHLEPWERGSRKTSGLTGMCAGVRGVGGGGVVSTAYCILYKLYTLKLTRKQVISLTIHADSPYIRALGFMYIRYTQPPNELFEWYEEYLDDTETLDVKAGGGCVMSIGQMLRQWLTQIEWFDTLFPRIPVLTQKEILEKLREHGPYKCNNYNEYSSYGCDVGQYGSKSSSSLNAIDMPETFDNRTSSSDSHRRKKKHRSFRDDRSRSLDQRRYRDNSSDQYRPHKHYHRRCSSSRDNRRRSSSRDDRRRHYHHHHRHHRQSRSPAISNSRSHYDRS